MSSITASTWPAPPASSPWEVIAARSVPPTTSARPATRPPVRSDKRPAGRRQVEAVYGVAAEFGIPVTPQFFAGDFPAGTRLVLTRRALKRSVLAIREGCARCALTLGHGGVEVTDSLSGAFELMLDDEQLLVKVSGHNAAGRTALAVLRAQPHRALSVGWRMTTWTELSARPLIVKATRVLIYEVSVVERGACPGARLFF